MRVDYLRSLFAKSPILRRYHERSNAAELWLLRRILWRGTGSEPTGLFGKLPKRLVMVLWAGPVVKRHQSYAVYSGIVLRPEGRSVRFHAGRVSSVRRR